MSKRIGLFLGAAAVIIIPVVTVLIAMQMRSAGRSSPGRISDEGYRITASGLKIKDEVIGQGEEAKDGQRAHVHYTGKFMNGEQFDSSAGKDPLSFSIGGKNVIAGWDEGVVGMKVGGKRKLIVPPDLAYGSQGQLGIPPNATLYFEIELLKLE